MYLIDIECSQSEGTVQLKHFPTIPIGTYAILSHTWGEDEVVFDDLAQNKAVGTKKGFAKIKFTCAQAWCDGLRYAWIDTCCIDKASSADLSEAINSMYSWYKSAAICYVYLTDLGGVCPRLFEQQDGRLCYAEDVDITHSIANEFAVDWQWEGRTITILPTQERFRPPIRRQGRNLDETFWLSCLNKCRWFGRGWTLQELLAPQQLFFFGREWNPVGSSKELLRTLSEITGVDPIVLSHSCELKELSVAKRLSWAANRQTSRIEDRAYCLLGLLGINMALLYGEGDRAFERLQEEIIRTSADSTLFAWCRGMDSGILAPSVDHFQSCSKIVLCTGATVRHTYEKTHRGIKMRLPLLKVGGKLPEERYLAILNCRMEDDFSRLLTLHLKKHTEDPTDGGSTIVCSVERCTQNCVDPRVPKHHRPLMHMIKSKRAEYATYRTVLIPRHNYRSLMALSGLRHTLPVWVRTIPQRLKVIDGVPQHQWNFETRVLSNYKKLNWIDSEQTGGLLLKSGTLRIVVCFSVGHHSEFIKVFRLSRMPFREAIKKFEIDSESRHPTQRRAMHQLPTRAIDHFTRVQARLKQDTCLGQNIWIIDVSLLE